MSDYNMFVPNVHFEQIPIKNLVSNQEYQRNLSQKHILSAASHFDLYQINPVKVSRRDGKNYVFNGQHTIEIVALVSGSRDTPVWCMIYDDLSYQHEADIFANQMKYVKPLTPYEIFMAKIIRDLVESYGLKISSRKSPCTVCAVSTLEYIFDKYGFHILDHTLRLCVGTWEGDSNSFTSNMMKAVAILLAVYGDSLNDTVFKEKLGAISVKQLTRMAKERRPGSLGYAEALVIEYNGKKKQSPYRLQIRKLYEKEHKVTVEPAEYDNPPTTGNDQVVIENYPSTGNLLAENNDVPDSYNIESDQVGFSALPLFAMNSASQE